jgi:predicted RNase H-like HicB family nuclease
MAFKPDDLLQPLPDTWYTSLRGVNQQDGHMKYYTFEIVVEKEPEDEGYLAYSPTLPGCTSNGLTIEAAKRNIREAIQLHLESLRAHGQEIPQQEHLVHVEELSVGFPS